MIQTIDAEVSTRAQESDVGWFECLTVGGGVDHRSVATRRVNGGTGETRGALTRQKNQK